MASFPKRNCGQLSFVFLCDFCSLDRFFCSRLLNDELSLSSYLCQENLNEKIKVTKCEFFSVVKRVVRNYFLFSILTRFSDLHISFARELLIGIATCLSRSTFTFDAEGLNSQVVAVVAKNRLGRVLPKISIGTILRKLGPSLEAWQTEWRTDA